MESVPAVDQEKLKQLFDEAQPTLAPELPTSKPTKLSELDRLKLENASLKLMNIGQQFQKLIEERARISHEFEILRQECLERYGVDVVNTHIAADGTLTRKGA